MPNLKTANNRNSRDTFHVFGSLSGIYVGDSWQTRQALSDSWVHRPKAASLHAGSEGVYSILINSRFRGEDNGMTITYSGPKIKGKGNVGLYSDSLIKNFKTKIPVRVIRGAKKSNPFAPCSGFRYDGLYLVEKHSKEKDHLKFFLRRLTEQSVAPWIKRVPNRPSPLTLKTLQSGDLSRYIAYIRCQSRTVSDGSTLEQEQTETEEDSNRSTSLSEESTNNPPEEVSTSDENNSPSASVGDVADTLQIAPDTNAHKVVTATLETVQQLQRNVSSSPIDETPEAQTSSSLPTSAPENKESAAIEPSPQVRGFPLPKLLDGFKEETKSAGSVVMETLPHEDYYEVYNEHVIYEEEEAHVTEVCSDDDVWVEEEIEIDSKVIQDVSQTQIVTALSLPQNHEFPSQKFQQRLGIMSDIDVEDGPKFGLTIGSSLSDETEILPEPMEPKQDTLLGQVIIKTDEEVQDGGPGELPQMQVTTEQEMENNSGDCLYIYPRTKWKNVDEAEQEILNGNFHWYQGNRPIQDPFSHTSDSVQESGETTLTQPNISNEVDGNEENVAEPENQCHIPYLCQQLSLVSGQKPDSTSNMSLDHISNECHPKDVLCQYNDVTLGELLAFTFNEPPNGCVCRYANRLPHMNYFIQQMLQARKAGFISENDVKQILPPQQDESEEVIGTISHVESVDSKTWNNVTQTDEDTSLPYNVLEESNGDGIPISTAQEVNSESDVEHVDGVVPQPISLNDPKMTSLNRIESLWRGLAEIRDEALKRMFSTPQPKLSDNPDKFKDMAGSTEEVDEKVPKLPSFYNERKEMILHHCRKRKIGNLRVDNECAQSSIIQEVSQPSKRRMVQLRNIRTEINCTRILQVNNNQLCAPTPLDKGRSNDSVEPVQDTQEINQIVDQVQEDGTNINSSESYIESAPPLMSMEDDQNNFTFVDGTVSFEQACDELCEEMHLKKQEDIKNLDIQTNTNNELEKSSAKKRGRPSVKLQGSSLATMFSVDNSSLSSAPLKEQKTRGVRPSALSLESVVVTDTENNVPVNAHTKGTSSPDSDTSSFERACDELCEELPKQDGDYSIPTPASISRRSAPMKASSLTLSLSANTGDTSKIDGELFFKKKGRPRAVTPTPPKEPAYPSPPSPTMYDPLGRYNAARTLKGFTNDDLCKIKQLKQMFDLVMLEGSSGDTCHHNNCECSKKKSDTEKSLPLRAKSSRPKQKARKFEL